MRLRGWICGICGMVRYGYPCECGACRGCCDVYVPLCVQPLPLAKSPSRTYKFN